jgi:hypothetical protein
MCRNCRVEFAPDREAIVAGAWRLCPACRNPSPDTPRGPAICPLCRRILKSGKHRGPYPGRHRRGRKREVVG